MTFQMTNTEREQAVEFLEDIVRVIDMRIAFHQDEIRRSFDVNAKNYNTMIHDEAVNNQRIVKNILSEIQIAIPNAHDIRNENQLDLIREMNK